MKLLYLTQHFPPESQAAAFRAAETAEKLAEMGLNVHVITGFPNLPEARKEAPFRGRLVIKETCGRVRVTRVYTPLDTKNSSFVRLLNYSSYMLLAFFSGLFIPSPTVIYASSPPLFVSLPGLALAKLKGAKYVLEVRDLWVDFAILLGQLKCKLFINLACRIERLVTRAADRIIVVTEGYKEHFLRQGLEAKKIAIIYGGVDFKNPVFTMADSGDKIKERYLLQDKFVVGYAGNIGFAQGLQVLLEAAQLLKDDSKVAFLLVGDGADRERLLAMKKEWGLNNVIFTGQVPREEVAAFVQSFDCSLITLLKHPLFEITLPSKLFEAMAYRKPILLGLSGEAKDIVERAGAGLFFDLEQPGELARAINYLRVQPEEKEQMADRGYYFARENFNRDHLVEKLSKLLYECGQAGQKKE